MMSHKHLCWLVASTFLLLSTTSIADTITLLDGTSYNGFVTYSNGKFKVRTQVKDGEFTRFVPREEVSLIEFNNLRTNPVAPPPEIARFQGHKCAALAAQSSADAVISDRCLEWTAGHSSADTSLTELKKSLPPNTYYSIDVTRTAASDDKAAMMKYADQKRQLGQLFDVPEDRVHVMSAAGDVPCDKCTYIQISRVHTARKNTSGRYVFTLVSSQTFSGALSDISENTINCVDNGSGTKKQLDRSQVSRISVPQ